MRTPSLPELPMPVTLRNAPRRARFGALLLEVLPELSQGSCIGADPSRLLGVRRVIDLHGSRVDGVDEGFERHSTRRVILLFRLQYRGVLDDEFEEVTEPGIESCRALLRVPARTKGCEAENEEQRQKSGVSFDLHRGLPPTRPVATNCQRNRRGRCAV